MFYLVICKISRTIHESASAPVDYFYSPPSLGSILHDSPSAQLCAALSECSCVSPFGVRSGHPVVSLFSLRGETPLQKHQTKRSSNDSERAPPNYWTVSRVKDFTFDDETAKCETDCLRLSGESCSHYLKELSIFFRSLSAFSASKFWRYLYSFIAATLSPRLTCTSPNQRWASAFLLSSFTALVKASKAS